MTDNRFKYHIRVERDILDVGGWFLDNDVTMSSYDFRLDEDCLYVGKLVMMYMFNDEKLAVQFKLRFG